MSFKRCCLLSLSIFFSAKSFFKNAPLQCTPQFCLSSHPEIIFEFILFNFCCCVAGESRVNSVIDENFELRMECISSESFLGSSIIHCTILQIHDFEYALLLLNELQKLEQKMNRSRMIERQIKRWRWDSTIRRTSIWSGAPSPLSSATQTFYCWLFEQGWRRESVKLRFEPLSNILSIIFFLHSVLRWSFSAEGA